MAFLRIGQLFPAQLPVLGQVEYLARPRIVLEQAKPPCDFLVSLFLSAKVAAEAVLV
jgi:hypothetical protein